MAASSTAPAPVRSPEIPPRLRSRAGRDAGSSDQDDRRTPRPSGPARESPSAKLLATATATLAAQRRFRIEQLLELGTSSPDPAIDPGRAEVHVTLQEAARSALRDIGAALRRIQQGSYGRCPSCGDTMTIDRLRHLPMAPQRERCQRATHRDAHRRADKTVPMVGVAREVAHRGCGGVSLELRRQPQLSVVAADLTDNPRTGERLEDVSLLVPEITEEVELAIDRPRARWTSPVRRARAPSGPHAAATHLSRRTSSPFSAGWGICSAVGARSSGQV
jgi:DnaK suppressor protein